MTSKIVLSAVLLALSFICAQAQESAFPNELPTFQFSKMERVRDLILLTSSKDDVAARFGKDCINGCDFDENWRIEFAYVGGNWSKSDTDNGLTMLYKPRVELVDRLVNINFRPRQPVFVEESLVYPAALKCLPGDQIRDQLKAKVIVCMDDSRVIYTIAAEANEVAKYQKNQLLSVHYMPSEAQEKAMYAVANVTTER